VKYRIFVLSILLLAVCGISTLAQESQNCSVMIASKSADSKMSSPGTPNYVTIEKLSYIVILLPK
jgi:hypothetical protein